MREQIESSGYAKPSGARVGPVVLGLSILVVLALIQPGCVLTTESIYTRPVYHDYKCGAVLVDTATGERRIVSSSLLGTTAPGVSSRHFFDFDWDRNGTRNADDAKYDWRRFVANTILSSSSFRGRSWCAAPAEVSCTRGDNLVFRTLPAAIPDGTLVDCGPFVPLPRLEVTALDLTPDNQLSFLDTPVGTLSAPVTFTVLNAEGVALRVNSVDFLGGDDAPDFVKTADTCLPTPTELAQGRGHLLDVGRSCTFQLQFRPQHRDGVMECDAGAPNESCRRRASLFVTGETATDRRALIPIILAISGRATGGGVVTEPTEICFPTAPPLGSCTLTQTLRIRNTSTGDLTLTSARLTRAGNRFEAMMPFLMPLRLPPGLPLDVPVRFCNVANDPTDGEFTINSSAATNPTTVVRLVNPLNRTCP